MWGTVQAASLNVRESMRSVKNRGEYCTTLVLQLITLELFVPIHHLLIITNMKYYCLYIKYELVSIGYSKTNKERIWFNPVMTRHAYCASRNTQRINKVRHLLSVLIISSSCVHCSHHSYSLTQCKSTVTRLTSAVRMSCMKYLISG